LKFVLFLNSFLFTFPTRFLLLFNFFFYFPKTFQIQYTETPVNNNIGSATNIIDIKIIIYIIIICVIISINIRVSGINFNIIFY